MKVKIEFFKREKCPRCPLASKLLHEILAEMDLPYEEMVKERDVDKDPEALTDLIMLNLMSTPSLRIGSIVLSPNDILNKEKVRKALAKELKTGSQ